MLQTYNFPFSTSLSATNLLDKILFGLTDDLVPHKQKNSDFVATTHFNIARYPIRKHNLDNGEIKVEFDMPGHDKTNIQVSYENETLQAKSVNYNDNIVNKTEVKYEIYLPDLDLSTIHASCDKGILTVTASHNKHSNKKHTIKIV